MGKATAKDDARGKATLVTALRARRRQARARPASEDAIAALAGFGPEAAMLRAAAGSSPRNARAERQTVTCVPTSTTRPVGIWKKFVASVALLVRPI